MPDQEQPIRFGQGLISGYISALLSLAGVFCFYFPELLTSEEFRKSYSTSFVRWMLFGTLIVS